MTDFNGQRINRRTLFTYAVTGAITLPLWGREHAFAAPFAPGDTGNGPYTLPPLPYSFKALEPHIDAKTMELHHDKHHATYVKNLNDAVTKAPELAGKTPVQLIQSLDSVPEAIRTTVRNNGGGHVNHTMFWQIMKPKGGGQPTGQIADLIKGAFGSFESFQTQFNEAGTKRFGSGWVWLVIDKNEKPQILSTPNQDNPLMDGLYPIMGNDVWEHAYYLKYQNRRPDYLKAWWNTVNWDEINKRLKAA
jgi:Fe-Mn family superoxide dismutase